MARFPVLMSFSLILSVAFTAANPLATAWSQKHSLDQGITNSVKSSTLNADWLLRRLTKSDHLQLISSFPTTNSAKDGRKGWVKNPEAGYDEETVFRAFWDVPNRCRERFGIEIPLEEFGIEFNGNGESQNPVIHGNVINVFGWSQIGYYPYLDDNNRLVNGGLPQLANITAHLEKAAKDIIAGIPDVNFNGIGMIDWEWWRPQWEAIENRYRAASMTHVRALHPTWNNSIVELVAKLEWTQGAKLFMSSTLTLAEKLRPKAVWGYYAYPYCNLQLNSTCPAWQLKSNDEIMWLFNDSTVIYPSIYLHVGRGQSAASVNMRLSEAFRMRDKSSDPKGVVLSYTGFNYSHTNYFFTLEDLNNTILKSAEFGTHGVVFWGDNYDDMTKASCQEIQTYVKEALGPVVKMTQDGARGCSQRICSSHGRCVGKLLTCQKTGKHRKYGMKNGEDTDDECSCRCFRGWRGTDCSIAE